MSYPDPKDVRGIEALIPSLLYLPNEKDQIDLDYLKTKVWSDATRFRIPSESVVRGMQANIFEILIENDHEVSKSIICKRIYPKELPTKENDKVWIDFIESVRREILFYKDFLSHTGESIGHLIPQIYDIVTNYDEFEKITDPMSMNSLIIMSNVSDNYYQNPAMNDNEVKMVLKNIAEFHAYYWNKLPQETERGSFWVLERRLITGELEETEVQKNWRGLLDRFPNIGEKCSNLKDLASLGPLLCSKARELEDFIQKGCVTRIHGDLKGWNLFISSKEALLIDMQWTGKGHPLQDVAYVLTTSLHSSCLLQMNDLVDFYIEELKKYLGRDVLDYEQLRAQYDIVWLDYVRVIVTGIWKKLSPISIEANKEKVGPSMINRSMEHVLFIIQRLHSLIVEKSLLNSIEFKDFRTTSC